MNGTWGRRLVASACAALVAVAATGGPEPARAADAPPSAPAIDPIATAAVAPTAVATAPSGPQRAKVTVPVAPGATLVGDPLTATALPRVDPATLPKVAPELAATTSADGAGGAVTSTLGDGALPPDPLPAKCNGLYTSRLVDELRWFEPGPPERNCWSEKAPYDTGNQTVWFINSTLAAGSTILPKATVGFRIDGTKFDGTPLDSYQRIAAWQNVWDNLFDWYPHMRGLDGQMANPTSGYNDLFRITPFIDNTACYDPSKGYNYGRWQETCTLKFGDLGPYYGVGAGKHLPWTVFGASLPVTGQRYIPAVFNCTNLGCPGPAVWSTGYEAQIPFFLEPSPYAGFSAAKDGITYTFTDSSLSDYPIVSQTWDFGDGTFSSEQAPTHQYRKKGTYTVTYSVTATNGQRTTTSGNITYDGCSRPCLQWDGVSLSTIPKRGDSVPFSVSVRNVGDEPLERVTAYAEAATDGSYTALSDTPVGRNLAPGQRSTFTVWIEAKKATGTLQLRADAYVPSADQTDTIRRSEAFPRAHLSFTDDIITVSQDPLAIGTGKKLTAKVVNDGNVNLTKVGADVAWDQPSVVVAAGAAKGAPTSLAPGQTATITVPFTVVGNGVAMAAITPKAKVGSTTVTAQPRNRQVTVGGASYTVTMSTTPARPQDTGTLDVVVKNTGDVDLTPSLDQIWVDRNGLRFSGVPATLPKIAPGASTTAHLQLNITDLGRFNVTLRSSATRATGDPLRREDTTAVRIGAEAKVDWEMEPRYEKPGDEATAPADANPSQWWLRAKVTEVDGSPCDPSLTATVKVDNVPTSSTAVKGETCTWRFSVPTLDKFTLGVTLSKKSKPAAAGETPVEPKDYLIVSVGDSLSSGEGVPRDPGILTGTWDDAQCHRSFLAGSSQAAMNIEADDPHSSVTFIHLACSGASVYEGLTTGYVGIDPDKGTRLPPQLTEARRIAGKRKIDALEMTIGINDMRFGPAVKHCLKWSIEQKTIGTDIPCEFSVFEGKPMNQWWAERRAIVPQNYAGADRVLSAIGVAPSAVHLYEYPDPTKDENGSFCGDRPVQAPLQSPDWSWFEQQLIAPLNVMGADAAGLYGWDRVGGISSRFTNHGMCSAQTWFVSLGTSVEQQRDLDGSFHPNYVGHSVYADALTSALKQSLAAPGDDAPIPNLTPLPLTPGSRSLPGGASLGGKVITIDLGTAKAESRRVKLPPTGSAVTSATDDAEVEVPWTYAHDAGSVVLVTDDLPDETGVNRAPVTTDDTVTVTENTPTTIDVLANDTDPNTGDTLNIYSVDSPHVTIRTNAAGKVTLRHDGVPPTPDCPDETVHVVVTDQAGASTTSTLTVSFACAPTVARVSSDVTVTEGNGPADTPTAVTVSLTAAVPRTVTVGWTTADGSAVAGQDYRAASGTLTFAPNETTKTVPLAVIGDTVPEGDDSFMFQLTSATGATIGGGGTRFVTIRNDDTVSIDPAKVVEGTGASPTTATITLRLSNPTTVPVTATWSTSPGSAASPDDFTAGSGSVTFPAGARTRTVQVPIVADNISEGDESFTFSAQITGTSTGASTPIGIVDDEAVPQLTVGDAVRVEGDTGTSNLVFPVTLSGPTASQTVRVNAAAVLGSASATDVQLPATTTLTFPAGTTTKNVTVPVVGDVAVEGDETVRVVLSAPIGAVIADNSATGTIVDDDLPLTASVSDASLTEQNGTMTFTISLNRPAWATTRVDVATVDGTAISTGATPDFTAKSATVSFAAGESSKTFTVGIKQDTTVEPNETFSVVLTNPTVGSAATPLFSLADDTGRGTIVNDDGTAGVAPGAGFTVTDPQVVEGTGGTRSLQFTVSLSAAQATSVSVTVATSALTATAGADYTEIAPTVVTFPAGTTTKPVNVAITTDAIAEARETLRLTLSAPTGGTVLWDPVGKGTIVDDDLAIAASVADGFVIEGPAGTRSVTMRASLSAAASAPVTIQWATADGSIVADTATVGSDYPSASGSVTIPAGATSATFTVAVSGDAAVEPNEAFSVKLTGAMPAGVVLVDDTAVVRISDDDV